MSGEKEEKEMRDENIQQNYDGFVNRVMMCYINVTVQDELC